MSVSQKNGEDAIPVCPRTGKRIGPKRNRCWLSWLFPLTGFVALIWFLVRVIPKPSRAAYPCQRVAFPLASGFVVWLGGVVCSFVLFRKAKQFFRKSRWALAEICLAVALITAWFCFIYTPASNTLAAEASAPIPNDPIGVAKGIYPGRVVWVHEPNATSWDGVTGYWWEPNSTDQEIVDNMMSQAIRDLAGNANIADAWDELFRYFNQNHDKGDVGYQAGEKITIKLNMVACIWTTGSIDPCTYVQDNYIDCLNCDPHTIVSLLRQLVNIVGVDQNDISIGDTLALWPQHYWSYCHSEFPNVHYLDYYGYLGRTAVQPSGVQVYWSKPGVDFNDYLPDYAPQSYVQADYLINLASLKGHSTGVTLCAKNHYGSLIRYPGEAGWWDLHPDLPHMRPGMGYYRPMIDLMGHSHIGAKTMLYMLDGLYGGNGAITKPKRWTSYPFNNDWPSSLFASQDPVAIDSVGFDFAWTEWPYQQGQEGQPRISGGDDYLHEAALANTPPSGTFYDPDGNGVGLESLGVHEHWNDPNTKQYTRNLGIGDGIELVAVDVNSLPHLDGDLDGDGDVDMNDLQMLLEYYPGQTVIIHTYEGVTTQSDDIFAYECDVDVFPFGGVMSNRNSKVEATDTEYIAIAADDANWWETATPASGDEILLWLDMKVEEDINSIPALDLTVICNPYTTATYEIYVMKTGTDWKLDSSWVKLGDSMIVQAGIDTEVTGTITSNFADYIDPDTGLITWVVYQSNTLARPIRVNYIEMMVKFGGAEVDINDDGFVDLLDFAVLADDF